MTFRLPPLEGTLFEGKYRLDRLVAEGGSGFVYAGHHLLLDAPIAIKVLKPADGDVEWPDRMAFFLEEARTLAKLQHPNVVDVLDVGTRHVDGVDHPVPWMVLEWLEGETLRDALGERRTPAECLALLAPMLEAIAEAHDRGIVHRDIKPSNVMLAKRGAIILDFGIAKIMTRGDGGDTPSGDTATSSFARSFTRASAAPEQLSGARTGPWTDVFALALLLTEMLTGRAPFSATDRNTHFEAVFDLRRPTPAAFGVDAGAWEPILAAALAVHPKDRPRNARALLRALTAALPGVPHVEPPTTDAPVAMPARASSPSLARRWLALPFALAAPAVLVALGTLSLAGPGRERAPLRVGGSDTGIVVAHALADAEIPGARFVERRLTSLEPNAGLNGVAPSHDRTRLAFGADHAVWIQQIATGERFRIPCADCNAGIEWLPGDRELLVGTVGGALEAIEVDTLNRRTVATKAPYFALAPDGRHLARVDPAGGLQIVPYPELAGPTVSLSTGIVSALAFTPSGRRVALVVMNALSRGSEELVIADTNGARVDVVARGGLLSNEGMASIAWAAEDRLFVFRPEAQGAGGRLAEMRFVDGRSVSEETIVHRSKVAIEGLRVMGDALAFVASESQDDVFVADLASAGDGLAGPLERVTYADSNEMLLDWLSPTRLGFLSTRAHTGGASIFGQTIGAPAQVLVEGGPDLYTSSAAVLTGNESGDVLFWRGGASGPPAPCELVRATPHGPSTVLAIADESDGDRTLRCRARVACSRGRCAVRGTRTVRWIDLARGRLEAPFEVPMPAGARIGSALAVAPDGRIAVAPDVAEPKDETIVVFRPDGSIEATAPLRAPIQSIGFARDGERLYAVDYVANAAGGGVVAIDLPSGDIHRLVERDSRWRGNPHVSPDGAKLAITVRTRQKNIALLEPKP